MSDQDKCNLTEAMLIIRRAIRYMDGSASVSFQIDKDCDVTAFKMVNNKDSKKAQP